jgi:hypothetical protein
VGIAGVGHHHSAPQQPGLLQPALFTGEDAQVVEGLGVFGLQLQQGLQQRPGFSKAPLLQEWPDRGHGRCCRRRRLPGHLDAEKQIHD